jgi:hypothetical protein
MEPLSTLVFLEDFAINIIIHIPDSSRDAEGMAGSSLLSLRYEVQNPLTSADMTH